MLVQAQLQHPTLPTTPFLMETTSQALPLLLHPMLPDGGILIDAPHRNALQSLVQWGYLHQTAQNREQSYQVTAAGIAYATQQTNPRWDGKERRRQERRSSAQRLADADQRRTDRRQSERLAQ